MKLKHLNDAHFLILHLNSALSGRTLSESVLIEPFLYCLPHSTPPKHLKLHNLNPPTPQTCPVFLFFT